MTRAAEQLHLVAVFLLAGTLAECKSPNSRSTVAATPVGPSTLAASDLAILAPLAASPSAAKEMFSIEGDGQCNVFGFDAGAADPIMSRRLFQELSDVVFAQLPPVRVDPTLPAATQAMLTKINERLRSPAAKHDAKCGEAISFTPFPDAVLLKTAAHIARIKGILGGVCNYENWRIVSMRFDVCTDSPAVAGWDTATQLPKCQYTEFRLVAQPIVPADGGSHEVLDDAIHLIYRLDKPSALIQSLRAFKALSDDAMKGSPWAEADRGGARMLLPHPGLRAEMNRCNGPVSRAFLDLVTSYAKESHLTSLAWMTSSTAEAQWTFKTSDVRGGHVVASEDPRIHENFSLNAFNSQQYPLTTDETLATSIHPWYKSLAENTAVQARSFAPTINALLNPKLISQQADAKHNSNCVSCHLADQTRDAVQTHAGTWPATNQYPAPPMWPPFLQRGHSMQNLRNFGYVPGFHFGVSMRTVNEVDALRDSVQRFFP
ncbi:MAG: hypothetical protein NTZ90_17185 [Proteobacteria bacterium]|nr:hypothetical protein [Pseudomonadota bacterium]